MQIIEQGLILIQNRVGYITYRKNTLLKDPQKRNKLTNVEYSGELTENDLIKEELVQYMKYYELSPALFEEIKKLKELLISLSFKFFEFSSFSELQNAFNSKINSNTIEGSRYLSLFSTCVGNIYLQMEKINISSPRELFDKNFNYFIALIR